MNKIEKIEIEKIRGKPKRVVPIWAYSFKINGMTISFIFR